MSWEVTAMLSATSSSKPRQPGGWWSWALFWKNTARFWPIWGSYLALWVLMLPVRLQLSAVGMQYSGGVDYADWAWNILETAGSGGILLAAAYGLICAMAVFSYLFQSRSAVFVHALPIRREGLFLTGYLSGLAFQLLPQLLVFFLTLLVEAAWGMVTFPAALQWLLSMGGLTVFFYSFAVFCAMFTGHILALPAFYIILNGLAAGMASLVNLLIQQFVYGFVGWRGLEDTAMWFSPFLKLWSRVYAHYSEAGLPYLEGFLFILLYGTVGVLLAAAALLLYRRRQLERAGDVVAVAWVKPIFKYGVASCAAVALGMALLSLLDDLLPLNSLVIVLMMLLCGLLGYFAAEMLLRKSFRVFRRSWKGAAAFCLILSLTCAAMELDVMGFNRPPALADVEVIHVAGLSAYPYDDAYGVSFPYDDPADLEELVSIHQYISDHSAQLKAESRSLDRQYSERAEFRVVSFQLDYRLRDGSLVERSYALPLFHSALDDPNSLESRLTALLNNPKVLDQAYFLGRERYKPVEVSLDVWNTETQAYETVLLSREEDAAALWEAAKADVAAGNLGRRFLFSDEERESICYTSNLHFGLYYTQEGALNTVSPAAESSPQTDLPVATQIAPSSTSSSSRDICLQTTGKETLACLRRLGVLDETHILLTHSQEGKR